MPTEAKRTERSFLGTSTPVKHIASPRISALDISSPSATPVAQKRRAKASEDQMRKGGGDLKAQTSGKKKLRHAHESEPYSRDRVARRRKARVDETLAVPGCILTLSSHSSATSTSSSRSAKGNGRKSSKKRTHQVNAAPTQSPAPSATKLTKDVDAQKTSSKTKDCCRNVYNNRVPKCPTESGEQQAMKLLESAVACLLV